MANDLEDAIKFIFEVVFTIFLVFAEYNTLKTCYYPMHIWSVGELVFFTIGLLLLCIEPLRTLIGSKGGIAILIAFSFWSASGVFMFIMSWVKTSSCMSTQLKERLLVFMIFQIIVFAVILFLLFSQGIQVFRRIFIDKRRNENLLEDIKNGTVNVDEYLQSHPDVDKFALFDYERKELIESSRVTGDRLRVLMQRPEGEKECAICMDTLDSIPNCIEFPVCNHPYHEPCIQKWLETKTTCPLCRREARSSLYRKLAEKRPRSSIEIAEQGQGHEDHGHPRHQS